MHKPDPVETILARLMPPALSEAAQRDIESMLDSLAGPAAAKRPHPLWFRRLTIGGIAAAGVAAAVVLPLVSRPAPSSWAAVAPSHHAPAAKHPSGMVLVGESDRIESMTDDGWQDCPDRTFDALLVRRVEAEIHFGPAGC